MMSTETSDSYGTNLLRFGALSLDPMRRTLEEGGRSLSLGGRAFDILMVLVERRGRIVTKDELIDAVWPGRVVEENTLYAQISILRRTCSSLRDLVRTVAGRGYQFAGTVKTDSAPREMSRPGMVETPDDNPLVIELAAARAREIGLIELAKRLDDRLQFLASAHRLTPRRQSLQASM